MPTNTFNGAVVRILPLVQVLARSYPILRLMSIENDGSLALLRGDKVTLVIMAEIDISTNHI